MTRKSNKYTVLTLKLSIKMLVMLVRSRPSENCGLSLEFDLSGKLLIITCILNGQLPGKKLVSVTTRQDDKANFVVTPNPETNK